MSGTRSHDLAGLRRVALLDGPEAGQEALAFSTGGGLDFWALLGRGLDIGPLWHRGVPVAWMHPAGLVAPQHVRPEGDGGTGIERALGGMLVTCGLDHVRQPRGVMPLHGHLPFTAARLLACGTDRAVSEPCLYAEAEAVSYHLSRGGFRLHRRLEAPVGGRTLRVIDHVENIGPEAAKPQLLYHWNCGPPLVGPGARLTGDHAALDWQPGAANAIHCDGPLPARPIHAELHRPADGCWPGGGWRLDFDGGALPWLQIWTDSARGHDLFAVEPATSGLNSDGTSGPALPLAPAEVRRIEQRVTMTDEAPAK